MSENAIFTYPAISRIEAYYPGTPHQMRPESLRDLDTAPGIDHGGDMLRYLSDPKDPRYKAAMKQTCEVCHARPNRPCWNTINSEAPLPDRLIHHARIPPEKVLTSATINP